MTIKDQYATFSSFNDFRDVYRADEEAPKVNGNDLVRVWNIVKALGDQATSEVVLPYAALNISQSSEKSIVSKLNSMLRHIGLRESRREKLSIEYVGFHHVKVVFLDVGARGASWTGLPAQRTGRGPDKVETRHETGHRDMSDESPTVDA